MLQRLWNFIGLGDEEEEEMLRHKYHIRIAKSPFEYRRKDLDD